jgi:mono/diheme cytochrome c family protein
MKTACRLAPCASLIALTLAIGFAPAAAQEDDIFAFIPSGGRTLLIEVIEAGAAADEVKALLSGRHASRDEWLGDLQAGADMLPGLADLDDTQLQTLADYLSFHMPLPPDAIPADLASARWDEVLPRDGRDLALTYCQSCHIITVTVTQDRTREAWLGTMNKPSHIEIKTTQAEREELANYLVLNAGIPIDDVPEDLRAGGASY